MSIYKKVTFLIVLVTGISLILFSNLMSSNDTLEIQYVQATPQTQTVEEVIKYKFPYMGNFSNTAHLFGDLPMGDLITSFRLYPDELTAQINYENAVSDIGEEILNTAILYNSVVAFSLIDNLEYIIYNFIESSYQVSRHAVESIINNFDDILVEENFIIFQENLNDYNFVIENLEYILVK